MPEHNANSVTIRPVTRWDWLVLPVPRRRQTVEVGHRFTHDEFAQIQFGSWPDMMEDKWFAFYEEPYLYLHRSWTGLLMYRIRLEATPSGARGVEVLVNRDRRAYESTASGSVEAEKALFLIRRLFFPDQHPRRPEPEEPEKDPVFLGDWSLNGNLLFHHRPPGIGTHLTTRDDNLKVYWILRGKLLAGFYPGDPDPEMAKCKIGTLLKRGIRYFMNLMEEDEKTRFGAVRPYSPILDQLREKEAETETPFRTETQCVRFPIRDLSVPSVEQMRRTLDRIDQSLHNEAPVYVHCLGGRGRTGTVVGCYLIRHGLATPHNVLSEIRRLRAVQGLDRDGNSPEMPAQTKFVLDWTNHDHAFRRIPSLEDQFRGCLLGLAVGDALGTTLEFKRPGTFQPIMDMVGGGPFGLKPGQWTDDTSMALCLADSLLSCNGFDPGDQLRCYVRWWRTGYLSSAEHCFDIGVTTREALEAFVRTGEVYPGSSDPQKAGNGSIMRLAPVPLFYFDNPKKAIWRALESSRTTHGARTAVDACQFLAALIIGALLGFRKDDLLAPDFWPVAGPVSRPGMHSEIDQVAAGSYKRKNPPDIKGTGYVVRSLEAALWAFYHSGSFKEGALLAVNLGDDADTTGAVYGQLAGAYYGATGIPSEWLDKLHARPLITEFADRLIGAIF